MCCPSSVAFLLFDSGHHLNAVVAFDDTTYYLILSRQSVIRLMLSPFYFFSVFYGSFSYFSLHHTHILECHRSLPPLLSIIPTFHFSSILSGAVYAILFGSETFDSIIGELQGATHVRVSYQQLLPSLLI